MVFLTLNTPQTLNITALNNVIKN